ncbi:MAG TPA: hypothetical protein VHZ51_27465 [Ktedonobacteraceae bacterium]|nr:hypothetical protein [Ktedonobacteraceae bacterium]
MTSFTNADGSVLVGGINPSSLGQALKLDASGNLLVSSAGGGGNVNIAQVNGAAPAITNPLLISDAIRYAIMNGQAFAVSTGKQAGPASSTVGLSIFNNATAKNLFIFSIKVSVNANTIHAVNLTSVDPALANALTPTNLKVGATSSAIAANCSYSNAAVTPTRTNIDIVSTISSNTIDVFTSDDQGILLPAGAANGIAIFITQGSNNWGASMKWIEF